MKASVTSSARNPSSVDTPFPDRLLTSTIISVKATDENLTSEDWGAIIDLCDKVSSDPNGPNQAIQGLIKRLAHRNANVQLYTLEVRRERYKSYSLLEPNQS